ncbi:ComEA family DNA-binding protein [Blastococcus mobilis]|uniref:Competence protein ComEA n=1 Tax=Blastococcus mobilis TaxID=1938746 RepID=A0A238X326_9ACTN|nr:ComEA family DNA-binding protein [Blastococcus mobilis]SNR52978.1 competence protein ComEA [Blastococcus mobilis]
MRLPSRRSDDADVIRQRLRLLLDERDRPGGWIPDDLDDEEQRSSATGPGWTGDDTATAPLADDEPETGAGLPVGVGRHRAPGPAARWDPGRYGASSLWLAGLLAALVLIGWTWLDRPRVAAVDGAPPASTAPPTPPVGEAAETSATVVVAVVGQVAHPGLVTLPSGSRVADAIAAAGGLLAEADPAAVNLAAVVSDGEQVAVGSSAAIPAGGAPAGTGAAGGGGLVDLNAAGVAELDALPGIGPVLAQRIVDHRSRHGAFRSVEELDDVPGIGPGTSAELAELVTV